MMFSRVLALILLCPHHVSSLRRSKASSRLGCWDSDFNPAPCKPHDCCNEGDSCNRCPNGFERNAKCVFSWHRCKALPIPTTTPPPKECAALTITSGEHVVQVEATLVGQTFMADGPPGYEVVEGKCTEVGNIAMWNPKPELRKVTDWCSALSSEAESEPSVKAAAIDEETGVLCKAPFIATVQVTTCTASGKFEPQPACQAQNKEHCDAYTPLVPESEPGLPRAPETSVGSRVAVTCASGFEADAEEVQCKKRTDYDTYFDPRPSCKQVPDWCLGRTYRTAPGSPKVPDSPMGANVMPQCAEGYAPTSGVVCNSRGIFEPRPSCQEAA